MNELEIPKHGEREYLRAFGVVSVFIAASSTLVPCLIGYTRDLGRTLDQIRMRWHWSVNMLHAWWLSDQESAANIIAAVNALYPLDARGLFDIEAGMIAAKVERVAANLHVPLTAHADAMRRVQLAVARVDGVIAAANAAGELRWFNRAYRAWRTSVGRDVAASVPYALARSRLRAAMVRRLATGDNPLSEDVLNEIFPTKIERRRGEDAGSHVPEGGETGELPNRMGGAVNGNGRSWYQEGGNGTRKPFAS